VLIMVIGLSGGGAFEPAGEGSAGRWEQAFWVEADGFSEASTGGDGEDEFLVIAGPGDGSAGGDGLEVFSMVLISKVCLNHFFSKRRILKMTGPRRRLRAVRPRSIGIDMQQDNALSFCESLKSSLGQGPC
jgi:hypothetical protein